MHDTTPLAGDLAQTTTPDWGPLERLLPLDLCGFFMWMHEITLEDGRAVHAYKHGDTRRYLHLADDGDAFRYVAGGYPGSYAPIARDAAIRNVFVDFAELLGPEQDAALVATQIEAACADAR